MELQKQIILHVKLLILFKCMIYLWYISPHVLIIRHYACNHRPRAVVSTTHVWDAICKCSLELWIQETPNRRTMLKITNLATIDGYWCFSEMHPSPMLNGNSCRACCGPCSFEFICKTPELTGDWGDRPPHPSDKPENQQLKARPQETASMEIRRWWMFTVLISH